MVEVKFIAFKLLEVLFGATIVGLCVGGIDSHDGLFGFIIFAGATLIFTATLLLLANLTGKHSNRLVSLYCILCADMLNRVICLHTS